MLFTFYVLRSKIDGSYYRGQTASLTERVKKHNGGGSGSTKGRRPWEIVYTEEYSSRSEAIRREQFLKSPAGWREWKEIKRVIEERPIS
jgi:putative endonuclease